MTSQLDGRPHFLKLIVTCRSCVIYVREDNIPIYRFWLYGLHGPKCPRKLTHSLARSPARSPAHSLTHQQWVGCTDKPLTGSTLARVNLTGCSPFEHAKLQSNKVSHWLGANLELALECAKKLWKSQCGVQKRLWKSRCLSPPDVWPLGALYLSSPLLHNDFPPNHRHYVFGLSNHRAYISLYQNTGVILAMPSGYLDTLSVLRLSLQV